MRGGWLGGMHPSRFLRQVLSSSAGCWVNVTSWSRDSTASVDFDDEVAGCLGLIHALYV